MPPPPRCRDRRPVMSQEFGTVPTPCRVCGLPNQKHLVATSRTIEFICERCGRYKATMESFGVLAEALDVKRPRLSCWVWEQNHMGSVPTFTATNLPTLLLLPRLQFIEKAKRLLIYMT